MDEDNRIEETKRRRRLVTDMSSEEAREYFLKEESYSTIGLPPYFRFSPLLMAVEEVLGGVLYGREELDKAKKQDRVNYKIMVGKDGNYAWRAMELIHPALYVSLVNTVTAPSNWPIIIDRFSKFGSFDEVRCISIPGKSLTRESDLAQQITYWWEEMEQKSIELALEYRFIFHTDITDCYPSIYTHSIAWALHTKKFAKKNRGLDRVGNLIDQHIQSMHNGQTNGIPLGSVLMDFIAEMVLGYIDSKLARSIGNKVDSYRILRYRDDYRIFVNTQEDGQRILKSLTEVLLELGLQLNTDKTSFSDEVIQSSLKDEKLHWLFRKQSDKELQKQLMIIHDHGRHYPDAGSLEKELTGFYRRITRRNKAKNVLQMISIIADIIYRNPRTIPIGISILSKLISFLKDASEKTEIVKKIRNKFSHIPHTGTLDLYLQRISFEFSDELSFDEPLCQIATGTSLNVWNNDWLAEDNKMKSLIAPDRIIDHEILSTIEPVIPPKEVERYEGAY